MISKQCRKLRPQKLFTFNHIFTHHLLLQIKHQLFFFLFSKINFLPQISFSTNLSWFDDVREGAVGLLDSGGQLDLKASQLQSLLTDGPQAGPCS